MKNDKKSAAITVGLRSVKMFIPHDLKAISSLSTESLPNDIMEASKIAIGIVSARMNGRLKLKMEIIVIISRCFSIIRFNRSIILSSNITKVVTMSEITNGLKFSFKIYLSNIFIYSSIPIICRNSFSLIIFTDSIFKALFSFDPGFSPTIR